MTDFIGVGKNIKEGDYVTLYNGMLVPSDGTHPIGISLHDFKIGDVVCFDGQQIKRLTDWNDKQQVFDELLAVGVHLERIAAGLATVEHRATILAIRTKMLDAAHIVVGAIDMVNDEW